jgi:molybdopterin molybdotransferase
MLPVANALTIVLRQARALAPIDTPLTPSALGLVLAEDVAADIDMPPFDKALMDGYAVRCADLKDGTANLPVQAEVMAGQLAPVLLAGHAIRIMTGAPVPAGADAVVQIEHTQGLPNDLVGIRTKQPRPGHSILPRGREMKARDIVLSAGALLGPAQLGLLALVGRAEVRAVPAPRICILATGDELVEAPRAPGPGQLRNSNGPMLTAQAVRAGALPHYLGIARDDATTLRSMLSEGLESPILVVSGGVSAGKMDLTPGALQELGVTPHFHQVEMKPGKPLFFGTRGETLVFGLPGNPVSSYCCFELFVRPAIRKLAGATNPEPRWMQAELVDEHKYSSDRPIYHPARLENVGGMNQVRLLPWFGSPDLRALSQANSFLHLPAGAHTHAAGAMMPVLALDDHNPGWRKNE